MNPKVREEWLSLQFGFAKHPLLIVCSKSFEKWYSHIIYNKNKVTV